MTPLRVGIASLALTALVAIAPACDRSDEAFEGSAPPADGWRPVAAAPLSARSGHVAVWTGRQMLVFGGGNLDAWQGPDDARRRVGYSFDPDTGRTTQLVEERFLDAAAYDPKTDRWSPLQPLKSAHFAAAFWAGDDVLVLGEAGELSVYSPANRSWREAAPWPFPVVPAWTAVWTGRDLIVWGGRDHQPELPPLGAAYDADDDRWRPIARFPLRPRQWHTAVWTGEEMIVWGGEDLVRPAFADGAAYNPQSDAWRVLAPAPISGRYRHHAVWTGKEMIVWGGMGGPSQLSDGAAYKPETDTWRELPPSPLAGRHWASVVWTGRQMIVWGGYDNERAFADGATYDPVADRWHALPAAPISGRCHNVVVWTGRDVILWGGTAACGSYGHRLADGAAITP